MRIPQRHLLGALLIVAASILLALLFIATRRVPPAPESSAGITDREVLGPAGEKRPTRPVGSHQQGAGSRAVNVVLPEPYAPIVATYKQLSAAANAGDAGAACRLAVDLSDCAAGQKTMHAMGRITENAAAVVTSDEIAGRMASAMDQAGRTTKMCEGVTEEMQASAFKFQSLAARLDPARYASWLASNPSLDRDKFLSNLAEWSSYREFAKNYFASSLKKRNLADLPALLMVYAPDTARGLRPPFQQAEVGAFLALYEVAESRGVPVPPEFAAEAQRLIATGQAESGSEYMAGWKGEPPSSIGEVYLQMYPKPMMADYCR